MIPTTLRIENFFGMGARYGLHLDPGSGLCHYSRYYGSDVEQADVAPSADDWMHLRATLDAVGAWAWHEDYDHETMAVADGFARVICDGQHWSVKLSYPDGRCVKAGGDEGFPEHGGGPGRVEHMTPELFRVFEAASRLADGRPIGDATWRNEPVRSPTRLHLRCDHEDDESDHCIHFDRDASPCEPSSLPISDRLRAELHCWALMFRETYGNFDAGEGYFDRDEEAQAFESEGRRLWRALRDELGPAWSVGFRSHTRAVLVRDESELADADRTRAFIR